MKRAGAYARPTTDLRRRPDAFVSRAELERAARVASDIDRPWIAKIASARSPVAYQREPLPTRPDRPLSIAQAAECATQVCVVLAELHARGWVGLSHAARSIRVFRDEHERWRAEVVVPPMPDDGRFVSSRAMFERARDGERAPVDRDLYSVLELFLDLLAGFVPMERNIPVGISPPRFELPETLSSDADRVLRALHGGKPAAACPRDAATLAAVFASLTDRPSEWTETIASLPRARPEVLARDWKQLCELGERSLRRLSKRDEGYPYIALPLANAWHQRAVEQYEAKSFSDALESVRRSIELDRFPRYITTKGTIQCAMGKYTSAITTFGAALESVQRVMPPTKRVAFEFERARALYARAVARMYTGDNEAAARDLADAAQSLRASDGAIAGTAERAMLRKRIAQATAKVNTHS